MSTDKNLVVPTCSSQKRKRHYSTERAAKIKLRRHDLHTQLSPEKKEMLLSRRGVTKVESVGCCFLTESAKEASCSGVGVELPPTQKALTIKESSVSKKVADTSCVNNKERIHMDVSLHPKLDQHQRPPLNRVIQQHHLIGLIAY